MTESPHAAEQPENTLPSRRSLRAAAASSSAVSGRRGARRAVTGAAPTPKRPRRHPVRRLAAVGAVAALVSAFAIPAIAATTGQGPEPQTIQQVAAADAQSLVVASDQKPVELSRDSYAATTPAEIAKAKAKAAAAAAAKANAARLASMATTSAVPLTVTGPGSGAVRWPLAHIGTIGEGYLARGGEHQGVDFPMSCGTPIFAATSGTVTISSEGYFGYGVAVAVEGVINGTRVKTLYAHMGYGSRQVSVGQHVSAGQPLGRTGNTGHSFGCHLHFETSLNGGRVDPLAWLRANAG